MVTPIIFLLAINCINFCISKSIEDRTFFLLAIDRKSINSRGYHIPMIDLGKIKKVTAVSKL